MSERKMKPKYEDKITVTLKDVEIPVKLWSDMTRYSNGSIHMGYSLATFKHEGKEGSIVAGGNSITVDYNGHTWAVGIDTIVNAVITADEQYEATAPPVEKEAA